MSKEVKYKDLIIIGGGPAGLTSSIYATRAKLNTLLLENNILGGQVRGTYTIENYPGFSKITGAELAELIQNQAEALGAEIDEFDSIQSVSFNDVNKIIETDDYIYKTDTVIIATGANPKKIPLQSGNFFDGKGIHYCAVCDGAMYQDKVIGVVGGGNSALEEAIFLTKFAKKVIMIRRYDYFNGEKVKIDEVKENPKIEIMYNEDLLDVEGKSFVEKAILKNTKTGKISEVKLDAIFGYIGTEPKTEMLKGYLNLTSNGYIITDENMKTNIEGVYAAGDVREKEFRQITTAVSDGTIAALNAEKYILQKRREK